MALKASQVRPILSPQSPHSIPAASQWCPNNVLKLENCNTNLKFIYFLLQTASSSGDPHVHIIKQVKATDEGLYTCIAGNVLGQATASAYLEVNAAVRQLSFDSCNLLFLLLLLLIAQNQLWINRLRRPLMAES